MIRVEGLEALVWFATIDLIVTAAFATRIVGRVLRLRVAERSYRQRLALWAATASAPSGDSL
jgi:hypothetical protein